MAQLPIMPLYTDAYLGDTQHLTLEEHGAYTRLLMIHWRMLPDHIPDDDARIARMLGITPRRWRALKPTICDGRLYEIRDTKLRQKRLENEWRAAIRNRDKKRDAANARWGGKPLENNDTDHADAYADGYPDDDPEPNATHVQMECPPSPSPSPTKKPYQQQPESQAPREPEPKAAAAAEDPARMIIDLFDNCRAEVFGEERRRPYPGPKDWPIAQEIAAAGADPAVVRAAFLAVFQRQKAQGQQPAERLSYMRGPVSEALAKPAAMPKGSGHAVSPPRDRDGEYRVWMQIWQQHRRWVGEGPPPDQPGCIVPERIRSEAFEDAA